MDRTKLRTVLYVDDEPDIRQVVQLALGLAGNLKVHTCETGEQALRELPTAKPDLLLLDVMMPGMDGPTTLQRIRENADLARLPVVFMTAKAMPQEVARFRELGAAGVIPKPFDPMQGFLMRTARGRMATRTAYQHFGFKAPERAATLQLFEEGR